MDNNRFIGFTLIMLLILTYYTFFPPGQNINEPVAEETIVEKVENQEEINQEEINSIKNSYNSSLFEESFIIENDVLKITFNNRGASISDIILKNYTSPNNEYLNLYSKDNGDFNLMISDEENISFNEILFDKKIEKRDTKQIITFTASNPDQKKITIIYEILEGYIIESKILLNDKFINPSNLQFNWSNNLLHQENNITNEKNQTRINYFTKEEEFDYTSATSTNIEEVEIKEPLKWISFKQQFFSSAIISENEILNSNLTSEYSEDEIINKKFTLDSEIPFVNNTISFKYYFGPNKYSILKNIEDEFHNNLYLGWFGVGGFNRYIIVPIFNFLENITSNYGLIILFMVFLIRIVVTPLTFKSHLSMAKMKVLNPEIQDIRKKHDGDMQKSQGEIMELYQKTGVSPLGGCLPILFQLPILVSVFYFLPNAIELRGKSFLWASDLSNFDSILDLPFSIPLYGDHISLFTILMTVSTILINKANSQMQTMEGPMKTIQYVLPFMFLFIFNNFSSGLTYYYFLSNVASYAQIFIFKRFVDEEKIKKEIEFNRKRNLNTKKSSFQLRLEEAMKAKQESKKKNR
tara:strand:- start:6113 stop:7852 length:1740 start_codon:yes stop_codon:yes gene_type:complete